MKRTVFRVMIVVAVMILAMTGINTAYAATIVGSKHDFSAGNTSGSTPFAGVFTVDQGGFPLYIDEICVFCHTPHGAANPSTAPYLWNRTTTIPAGYSYNMYSSTTMSGVPNVTGPTGVSLMCMSCHDGVTSLAVNTLLNAPGAGNPAVSVDTAMMAAPGAIGNAYAGAPPLGWGANLGELTPSSPGRVFNLSNDHPISFAWSYTKPDLNPSGSINPKLRLFGPSKNEIQCATCHLVHDPGIPPFLAMDNAQSAMCLSCHNK